jgi:RTX calcium-binding nonapeptide repeat (4 copies)
VVKGGPDRDLLYGGFHDDLLLGVQGDDVLGATSWMSSTGGRIPTSAWPKRPSK